MDYYGGGEGGTGAEGLARGEAEAGVAADGWGGDGDDLGGDVGEEGEEEEGEGGGFHFAGRDGMIDLRDDGGRVWI